VKQGFDSSSRGVAATTHMAAKTRCTAIFAWQPPPRHLLS